MKVIVVGLFSNVVASFKVLGRSQSFLAADMQPEVVAHTLVKVEEEWRAQAAAFAECNTTSSQECNSAADAFQKSCGTVVSAVVKSSSGDKAHVKEYMGVVCLQHELAGWHQERCAELATNIYDAMSDDNYENRENFNAMNLCTNFWSRFTVQEKARVDQERAEREAAEKKAEEDRIETEKQLALKAAEEQKRLEHEAAEQKAAEEKRRAEEAAAALRAKKEEAEKQAVEAKHKMEEAQQVAEAAAKHHREALENATKVLRAINQTKNEIAENLTAVVAVAESQNFTSNTTHIANVTLANNDTLAANMTVNVTQEIDSNTTVNTTAANSSA